MDYYSVLGVSKNASDKDIKTAFRRLAAKHHPDAGGDAEEFKKINEAYNTLKDPNKRREYDNPQPQFSGNPFGGMPNGFEHIFEQFGFRPPPMQRNQDIKLGYTLEFEDIFYGRGITLQYQLPSSKVEILDVRIPPGVKDGETLQFAGYGDNSIPGLPRGNMFLRLKVKRHPYWEREGENLRCTKVIDIFDFIFGNEIVITTPENRNLNLTVPKGTKPGTTFSITGHGVPNIKTGRKGNLYITLKADVPKLTDQQILKIRKILTDG